MAACRQLAAVQLEILPGAGKQEIVELVAVNIEEAPRRNAPEKTVRHRRVDIARQKVPVEREQVVRIDVSENVLQRPRAGRYLLHRADARRNLRTCHAYAETEPLRLADRIAE